jgi:hypothetical protein
MRQHDLKDAVVSSYLILKLCYVKEFFELDDEDDLLISEIDRVLGNAESWTAIDAIWRAS